MPDSDVSTASVPGDDALRQTNGMEAGYALSSRLEKTPTPGSRSTRFLTLARLIHEGRDLRDGCRLGVDDRCVFFTATENAVDYVFGLSKLPAIAYMTEREPNDMNWLTSGEARSLGIYVEEWVE